MFDVNSLVKTTGGVLASGKLTCRFPGISINSRTTAPGEIFVAIIGKRLDGHDFIQEALDRGATGIIYSNTKKVKSPQKGIAFIRVSETTKALGEIASYHRSRFDIPVIAVTGSSGKTTTKEMIAWVLSSKFNVLKNIGTQNNLIGVPLTLFNIHSKHDVCVIEMGTNRVGEIEQLAQIAKPNVGVVTNIGPAHLEFLGNLKGVYKEKINLIKHLSHPGIAILNKADMFLTKLSSIRSKPFFFFGINRECEFRASEITYKPKSISFTFNSNHSLELKHCALHNVSNALAAIACGMIFGLDFESIKERIESIDSPDMRLKEITLKDCVVFDDSYNSNPQSLKQAIDVLCRQQAADSRRILVIGDMMELGEKTEEFHSYFGRYVSKKPIDILVTFGTFSKKTSEAARKSGMSSDCVFHFDDCAQVTEFLLKLIKEKDVLLIKGSRSMKMERIVASLKERC